MLRAALLTSLLATPVAAGSFLLDLPADCQLGKTCFIQQFVDRDPGPGAADFTCGTLSYDGHQGTDFAVPTLAAMHAGVDVLAAAPGTVVAIRDGMADTGTDTQNLDGRECGNGVLIRHGGGWETQYCHLKQGSIIVARGQRVAKGAVLGEIGLSGQTEFPHVHLAVRRDGEVIDPFDPAPGTPTCNGDTAAPLWQGVAPYRAGDLLGGGFSNTPPSYDAVLQGLPPQPQLSPTAPALVLWGYAFGGRKGDMLRISITYPDGQTIQTEEGALDRDKARFYRFFGRRLSAARWPAGRYAGRLELVRDGEVIAQRDLETMVPN